MGPIRDVTRVWLASYPKSGNTWFRMLLASLAAGPDRPLDINDRAESQPLAARRAILDDTTLIDTSLLTHEEADALRARVFAEALPLYEGSTAGTRFYKVHDAYAQTPGGAPALGRGTADVVILIVRDPRDVAVSLASHFGWTLDSAIAFMRRDDAALHGDVEDRRPQVRQRLLSWSGHAASWLDQKDVPLHLIRYESLHANTANVFRDSLRFAGRAITEEEARRVTSAARFANLQAQERERGFREGVEHGGPFFRRGVAGGWKESLTAGQAAEIEHDHREMMERLGYDAASWRRRPDLCHHLPTLQGDIHGQR